MSRRILFVVIAALLAPMSPPFIANSLAETKQPNYDRLKKLLDEKYLPKKDTTQKPSSVDKKDLYILPSKQKSPTPPDKQGFDTPRVNIGLADLRAKRFVGDLTARSLLSRIADRRDPRDATVQSDAIRPGASDGRLQLAQVVAKRNTYVIMLKPNTTGPQLDALLAKYHLTIERGSGSFGLIRVVRDVTGPNAAEVQKLSDVLNQQIVTQLRREPIVASVTVDSTVRGHSIPKASDTKVDSGGTIINWNWGGAVVPTTISAGLTASAPALPQDGNWGLKAIRLPPVWTVLQRYRELKPNSVQPKVAIIDSGFAKHDDLNFNLIANLTDSPVSGVSSSIGADCTSAHGNHVAGIIGAIHGNGIGIDGVVPRAKIDVVPWDNLPIKGDEQDPTTEDTRVTYFSDALIALMNYVDTYGQSELKVINVSLGFNFGAAPVAEGDPATIPGLKDTILGQAVMFARVAQRYEDRILFVTSAGNDSNDRAVPFDAKWSSPIVWAATQLPASRRPKNILIVEATDRSGQRASFSNVGGTIAAPGVDILSTLWPGNTPYGACMGTSQAAPHVAGVAAMLFELDPTKKPADIVNVLKASAIKPIVVPGGPPAPPGAPRLDALEAVLKLSPNNLVLLTDLNRDGKVDIEDMKIFMKQMTAIGDNRKNGTAFTEDLNGDGVVDNNECNWPMIDFNGSGTASLSLADAKIVGGLFRTDLDIMAMAWTDKTKDFATAMKETGLDAMLQAADAATGVAPVAPAARACR
ncbi:MAG TPA: S8 family serine peptidase [Xanthobacteraceae bacterium]|nr:S8 family serine peptidase [Xanthobacteraceae bacterium]